MKTGWSHTTLKRTLIQLLARPPVPIPKPHWSTHLIIDATFFGRSHCLVVYWDYDFKHAQYWRYTTNRELVTEIASDLRYLQTQGVFCSSITSDGGPGIAGALEAVYPRLPHQRCLVHIKRQVDAWLSTKPKTSAGKELKKTMVGQATIANHYQKDQFVTGFRSWCIRYESFLNERTYLQGNTKAWQHTHRNLRRCRSLLQRALPDMWHYLDDRRIPKDTNGLEGRFGGLKQHYRQHRGLSKHRREAYLSWYVKVCTNGQNINTK